MHIHLAWGQIGVTEALNEGSSTSSPSISQTVQDHFFPKSASNAFDTPCFLIHGDGNSSHCLLTIARIPESNPPSSELGILLSESFNTIESWQMFLKNIKIPNAELLAFESRDDIRPRGGNAAGNLLWVLQSLGRTYYRTRELLKVYNICLNDFWLKLPLECSGNRHCNHGYWLSHNALHLRFIIPQHA
jgi:hypothetical protein